MQKLAGAEWGGSAKNEYVMLVYCTVITSECMRTIVEVFLLPNWAERAFTESETEKKSTASHDHASQPEKTCSHWMKLREARQEMSVRRSTPGSLRGMRLRRKYGTAMSPRGRSSVSQSVGDAYRTRWETSRTKDRSRM